MNILVYGAGNIGSLYASLLKESGQEVSLLARGKRLAEIREHGLGSLIPSESGNLAG